MRYASPGAFRTALEARLKVQQTPAISMSRLRKRIVFERLLARLQTVAPDDWYLKGGFALELRIGAQARTTKDVDIDWAVGEDEATELLLDAAARQLDDWFVFDVRRSRADEGLAGGGQRWRARAELAGREFDRVAIDVGFSLPPVVPGDSVPASDLLAFAGIDALIVPALAVEQHLAEKLHAYSRVYAGDQPSSRVKDLVDVVVITRTTSVDADRLTEAVRSIFERRGTHEVPRQLPRPPSDWARPWSALVEHLPADADLASGAEAAEAFWNPLLASAVVGRAWEPDPAGWRSRN
jgi:predicted nucleotidyltransferase component of viral defense system